MDTLGTAKRGSHMHSSICRPRKSPDLRNSLFQGCPHRWISLAAYLAA